MNNAILTLASGYSFEDLRVFITSLNKTGFNGVLYLIIKEPVVIPDHLQPGYTIIQKREDNIKVDTRKFKTGLAEIYNRYRRRKITKALLTRLTKNGFSDIGVVDRFVHLYHCQLSRFALYLKILQEAQYDHILLTDSRDVYFQKDPFESIQQKALFAFMEDNRYTIKERWYNRQWIKIAVGNANYEKVKDRPVFCSGTILGDYNSVVKFLETFIIKTLEYNVPFDIKGIDQGLYNFLIHTNELSNLVPIPNQQLIMTVSTYNSNDKVIVKDFIYNDDLTIPAVVHQYDRKNELIKFIVEKTNKFS
jgi:hypothetical protein